MSLQEKSSFNTILIIGITIFALFFGAGNLIFPVMLGQLAGDNVNITSLGFVITAVLLPILGVVALAYSGEGDFLKLAQRAGKRFGLIYVTTLYLTIGPLFAMPRTGSVSYEIGLRPFISEEYQTLALAIFTLLFFLTSCLLSINPYKVVDIIGNYLAPLKIFFILVLVIASILSPMGLPQAPANQIYTEAAFFAGFTNGYLTMDALASFIFGIIVVYGITQRGITQKKAIVATCIKASVVAIVLLTFFYIALAYLGANSVQQFGMQSNGGAILAKASLYYFNTWGNIILGLMITVACLTTCVGLTCACAAYFQSILPCGSYRFYAILFSLVSGLFANVGLELLINFSVPILAIIYPVAIVLIALTFSQSLLGKSKLVYLLTIGPALIMGFLDGLNVADLKIAQIDTWLTDYLPFYPQGMGWLLPTLVGALLSAFYIRYQTTIAQKD